MLTTMNNLMYTTDMNNKGDTIAIGTKWFAESNCIDLCIFTFNESQTRQWADFNIF